MLLVLGKRLVETVLPVVTSLVNKLFRTDIGGLPDILGGIHKWIEKIYTKVVLMDGWPDWLQGIVNLFKNLSDAVGKFFEKFKPIDTIINAFKKLWNGIKMVYGYIKEFVKDGLDKLKLSPEGSTFIDKLSGFGTLLASGGIIVLVKKLFDYFKAIKEMRFAEGIKTFFSHVGDIFDKLKEAITAFQKDTPPDMLMKIAKSIALIAASLFLLSLVKVENLVFALTAFAAAIQIVFRAMKKLGETEDKFSKTIDSFLKIAVAMGIISASLSLMATTKPERLLAAVAALGASLTMMLVFLKKLKGVRISGSIKQIKNIAKAMLTLSIAFKIIGSMEWEQIGKALTAMGASLLTMMIIIHSMEGMKSTKNGISGITKIAFAMIPMAIALKILGTMGWENIGKALTAMVGAMTIMVASILIMSKLKGKNGGAGSILVMAMAMIPLALALKILGSMDLDSIGRALFAVASVMAIFGVMVASMSNLKASMFAVAGALILFSVALLMLTPALLAMGAIPMDMIVAAIVNMGIAIGAFAAASFLLAPVLPLMWSLATIMLMVGTAAILTGIGIAMLAGALAGGSVAIVAAVAAILDVFIMFIPVVAVQLAIALKLFIQYLAGSVTELVDGLVKIVMAICIGLLQVIPALIVLIGDGISMILWGLVKYIPEWAVALGEIVYELIMALEPLLGRAWDAIVQICVDLYNTICDFFGIHSPSTLMADVGRFLIEGLINGVGELAGSAVQAMADLGSSAFNAIKDGLGSLWDIGVNAVQGLIDGIGSMARKVWDTAKSLGGSLMKGIKDFLGIKSPSREMKKLGVFSVEGFVNGLDQEASSVVDSAKNMGQGLVSSLNTALEDIRNPKVSVSPYVDFNNLQLADTTMSGMFARKSMELAVDVSRNRLQVDNMRDIINETNAAIGDLKGAINDQKLEANVETPIYLDGREIARSTAKYTKKEIDNIDRQNGRFGGKK
nr:MAG TPA: tail tape measure [Caudoviricetes sp.]